MKTEFYLVVSKTGSVRTVKNRPALDWNEVSINLNLNLPDTLFSKPLLKAELQVNPDSVTPQTISVDMQNNIKEAIQQHTGVPIIITVASESEV
jgi:hypothetical protein